MGIAEADQARALGMRGDAALEGDGAHVVGRAFGRAHVLVRILIPWPLVASAGAEA